MSEERRVIIGAFSPSMINEKIVKEGVNVHIRELSPQELCEKINSVENPIMTMRHGGTAKAVSDLCGKKIEAEGKTINDVKPGDEIIAILLNTRPGGDKADVKPDELKFYLIKILGQA